MTTKVTKRHHNKELAKKTHKTRGWRTPTRETSTAAKEKELEGRVGRTGKERKEEWEAATRAHYLQDM